MNTPKPIPEIKCEKANMSLQKQLEEYLHEHIPISLSMGIKVECVTPDEVILCAPFSKNFNHKKTIFGGSLHAVATLACWSLLHINLKDFYPIELVITHSNVDYIAPVTADFRAHSFLPEDMAWKHFTHMLRMKKKARISMKAEIYQHSQLAVDYEGTFAAIKR